MKRNQIANILVAITSIAIVISTMSFNVSAEESTVEEDIPIEWTAMTDAYVSIEFDKDGCPVSVNPPDFYIRTEKEIFWQAVDKDGKAIRQKYNIFFAPIKSMRIKSTSQGRAESGKIETDAALSATGVEYKYSIVGDECTDYPLDPRFRLR